MSETKDLDNGVGEHGQHTHGHHGHEQHGHHGHALRIALAGNPNCGKTTVFNGYTGARQHVGNYPGVTVDKKEGHINVNGTRVIVVDLPGTYSLTAYSQEELVARQELASDNVQAVINVVDASALERNLLLTVQMLEMGTPVVLSCNMMDEARNSGVHIAMDRLSALLGIPVLPMVARTGEGLKEAMEAAVELSGKGKREPMRISYGAELDEALLEMEKRIVATNLLTDRYLPSWVALKLLEGDDVILNEVRKADPKTAAELEGMRKKIADHTRVTLNASLESLITDHRYGYIRSILRDGVFQQDPGKDRLALSDKLDKVLTNALFGPLLMIGVLYLMFYVTFKVGDYPKGWVEDGFAWLGGFLGDVMADGLAKSLVVDGVIAGVGGVISFVPLILIMFVLISFMEDSGYMARVAYMMDRIFRFFGLHGASVMPYIISGGIAGGCAIPGAMATRTLRSPKEKLATLLTLPYMACGAKLPVFLMLAGAFFADDAPTVMFLIMLVGWVMALLVARLLRSSIVKGEATPFVMELPPYRMPTLFSLLLHCWERAWMYLKKAGTILVAISIIIWAGMTFPKMPEDMAAPFEQKIEQLEAQIAAFPEGAEERTALEEELTGVRDEQGEEELAYSIAGRLGKAIEPATMPVGFDWRTDIALLAGVAAKEAIVSTLGTAYAIGAQDPEDAAPLAERLKSDSNWSKATALSLMLFVLMYSPCFVALVVIKQEAGSWGWLIFSMVFNTAVAYVVALVAYQVGRSVWGG
ncbi:ferrous iron transport protein B [Desulfovibrio sp. 86]|uniref:Ferrous iron transport protein B n=1 Tax=uncultured Desulfovibrio sp. TaxID=167968 RepID=A0A212LAU5_9BACT|nr:ferrous iron transport protein B [Desulfovibrio sp. 86]SCM74702.1 Ferrous iron transport protein B [uncultured Desulfovibrio sp.]VZH34996.1 Fe(2+) transport protein A/Fe(2+) transporter FeoB fusion protein [Desulfovibrio sp. 86]